MEEVLFTHFFFSLFISFSAGEPFDEIFPQTLRCPYTELRAAQGFYPVTHRNDHIQVVKIGPVFLHFPFYCAVFSGCSELPNNQFRVQFAFLKNMLDMFANVGLGRLEQLRHGRLREPNGIVRKPDLYFGSAVFGLVK